MVHFTLDYPDTPGAMIFLDGDFTQRRFDDNSRMLFNPSTGLYERSMLLKQGAYNYQYLIVPRVRDAALQMPLKATNIRQSTNTAYVYITAAKVSNTTGS